jgi:ABC-type Na+ efflux pump permease subunit
MKTRWLAVAVIAVLAVSLPAVSFAQAEARATLTGDFTDPSGAVIRDVTITAEPQTNTGVAASTKSDAAGHFSLTLVPGNYRVVISAPAFERVEENVTLAAGETREMNVKLTLEKLSASVVVTASAEPMLAADSAAPVDVVTRQDIDERDEIWLAPVLGSEPGAAISRLGAEGGVTNVFSGRRRFRFHEISRRRRSRERARRRDRA